MLYLSLHQYVTFLILISKAIVFYITHALHVLLSTLNQTCYILQQLDQCPARQAQTKHVGVRQFNKATIIS